MQALFLIPGIMGTELFLPRDDAEPEKIWPPTPLETQVGYQRSGELQRADVFAGDVIRNVLCFDVYKPLFKLAEDLGFTADGRDKWLVAFPYDWRLDLFVTAGQLADKLDAAHHDGASDIVLVAHSMGGLIARLILEGPTYRDRPWFGAISLFIAIATPHRGAPLALGRVLGCDSAMGISGANFAAISNNENYPSAYQLLPAPGEMICWDQNDRALHSLDIYDPAVINRLGLKPALIERVRAVHDVLGAGNQPAAVRYFYFAAAGHRTVTRVNIFSKGAGSIDPDRNALTRTADGGDGTVPLFSAIPGTGQRQIVINEHSTAFKGDAFRRVFVRLLGGYEGDALEGERDVMLSISVESPLVSADDDVEVLLYPVDQADDARGTIVALDGGLVLRQIRQDEQVVDIERQRIPIRYAGPPLNRLRTYLNAIGDPGHYELRFEGSPRAVATATFSVCAPLARAGALPGKE